MKKTFMGLSVLVLLFGVAHNAAADLIPINNQGFEDLLLSPGQYVYSVPGWETTGLVSTFYPTDFYFIGGAPEGHNTVALGAGGAGPASVSQLLSDVLTADTTYTLTVDVGRRLDIPLAPYSVQLAAGGVVLNEATETEISAGEFIVLSIPYFASSDDPQLGQPLEIRLLVNDNGGQVNFDDVTLDATPK